MERHERSPSCSSCGPWWRLPLLLVVVLTAVWLSRGGGVREAGRPAESGSVELAVSALADTSDTAWLEIDAGDGNPRKLKAVAWRPGMTVYDLMRASLGQTTRLEVRGTGESAFLSSLDGVANEGAGGRNWMYTVNGRHADRSFAVYELQPGDHVLWSFAAAQ